MNYINPVCPTDAEQEKSDTLAREETREYYYAICSENSFGKTIYDIQIEQDAEVIDCTKGTWVQAWVWLPQ